MNSGGGYERYYGPLLLRSACGNYRTGENDMKKVLIIGLVALAILTTGCDLYRTTEGTGIIGPNGGWFVCYDENDCSGY